MKARLRNAPRTAGIDIIAAERARQLSTKGFTAAHDDKHEEGEIALAAACYAIPGYRRDVGVNETFLRRFWPWDVNEFRPSNGDRVRELAKAGALIAAEIDRLQRAIDAKEDVR